MLNAMGAGIRLCGTVRVRMDQMDYGPDPIERPYGSVGRVLVPRYQ